MKNFLFHRVNAERDILWDPMDPVLFEKCIKYISKKYKVILFEDFYTNYNEYLNIEKKLATIMFDDGYKDNFDFAIPILQKYNVKASFYVVTDCIDKNIPTWTHILEYSFLNTKKNKLILNFDFLVEEYKESNFESLEEKIKFVNKLKPYLKTIKHVDREVVLNKILQEFDDIELPNLMMNWNEIREIVKLGHYVGSHTKSHLMLGTIDSKVLILDELMHSAKRIESELGYFPLTISYPVGSYSNLVKELSNEVGYKIGLAVKQDEYIPNKNDFFEVERIELYNEKWLKTWLRITHILEKIKKIIRYR